MGETIMSKEIAVVVDETTAAHKAASATESQITEPVWEPGFWKQFPWLGAGGLCLTLICTVSAVIVLHTSDKQPASSWLNGRLAPNVVLTILNSLSNLAITVAIGQGIAISWWRRALTGGTIKQLHYSWTFSTSMKDILTNMKYFNVIALAALMAKISVIDGVLFQRSTSTYLGILYGNQHNGTFSSFGATSFPPAANMGHSIDDNGLMTYDMEAQVLNWDNTRLDIDQNSWLEDCNGVDCHYFLDGMGFSVSCANSTQFVDYGRNNASKTLLARDGNYSLPANLSMPADPQQSANASESVKLPLFNVNFTRSWPTSDKNYSALTLNVLYARTSNTAGGVCPMDLVQTTCELRPAVLTYKLQYSNDTSKTLSQQNHEVPGLKQPERSSPYATSSSSPLTATLNTGVSGVRLDYDCPTVPGDSSQYQEGCAEYDPDWEQIQGVRVLRTADIVENFSPYSTSRLEAFFIAIQTTMSAQSHMHQINGSWVIDSNGMMAVNSREIDPPRGSCAYAYSDPLTSVLNLVNILTLMTTQNQYLYYNHDDNVDWTKPKEGVSIADAGIQTFNAIIHYSDIFYQSDDRFMFGAMAATFLVVLCILPVFWGFWELGRKVTLGPFEIANAFQGPAFSGVKGDHVEEVIGSVGDQRLKYGHIVDEGGRRLGFSVA